MYPFSTLTKLLLLKLGALVMSSILGLLCLCLNTWLLVFVKCHFSLVSSVSHVEPIYIYVIKCYLVYFSIVVRVMNIADQFNCW